jgi:hypothetical protein
MAAQDSGWVRFGAWIGDRSARRIMELEQEDEVPEPLTNPSEPEAKGAAGPQV